jgi:hypothetical protein
MKEYLFVPGAVDIYNLPPNGLWLSRAVSRVGADDAALASLEPAARRQKQVMKRG